MVRGVTNLHSGVDRGTAFPQRILVVLQSLLPKPNPTAAGPSPCSTRWQHQRWGTPFDRMPFAGPWLNHYLLPLCRRKQAQKSLMPLFRLDIQHVTHRRQLRGEGSPHRIDISFTEMQTPCLWKAPNSLRSSTAYRVGCDYRRNVLG